MSDSSSIDARRLVVPQSCTGLSCGSTAPPSEWMTSKLWHSLIRLQKSSNVPARRPLWMSMMLGGPDVGAKQTCRPPTVHVEFGIERVERELARRRGQRLGDQAAIDAHDLRRLVDFRARLRVALAAPIGREHLHALVFQQRECGHVDRRDLVVRVDARVVERVHHVPVGARPLGYRRSRHGSGRAAAARAAARAARFDFAHARWTPGCFAAARSAAAAGGLVVRSRTAR